MAKKQAVPITKVAFEQPITVRIEPEEKESEEKPDGTLSWLQKIAFGLAIFLAILALLSNWFFVINTGVQPVTFDAIPAVVTVDWPHWASLKDAFTIKVLVQNTGATPLNGRVDLILAPAEFTSLLESGMTSIEIKELAPGASSTQIFTLVPLRTPPDRSFTFDVRVKNQTVEQATQAAWQVNVIGFPRLQALLAWILGTGGLVSTLTGLLWEQVKKAFS